MLLDNAICTEILDAGAAAKLAGKLMWATQHLFHRLGRAMIRPLFGHAGAGNGQVGNNLRRALKWWRFVLSTVVTEQRPWLADSRSVAHLWVDAASTPAWVSSVLYID